MMPVGNRQRDHRLRLWAKDRPQAAYDVHTGLPRLPAPGRARALGVSDARAGTENMQKSVIFHIHTVLSAGIRAVSRAS
jgi:hypothetical protein